MMKTCHQDVYCNVKLFVRKYGQGQPVIVLHGLFGSSDNWMTQAKMLADHFAVYALDLRNHGQSPHSDAFDYQSMVDDVVEFCKDNQLANVVIIGHSMGGKVAMNLALLHPDLVRGIIVVDIAPRAYDLEHYVIAEGLNAIPTSDITTRQEADDVLARYVSDGETRQFLLKNLQRKQEGGFSWKLNLPVITEKLQNVGVKPLSTDTFTKPVLFIKGIRSAYIKDDDTAAIHQFFPNATIEHLDTGHWVQAEAPKEFIESVVRWLKALPSA